MNAKRSDADSIYAPLRVFLGQVFAFQVLQFAVCRICMVVALDFPYSDALPELAPHLAIWPDSIGEQVLPNFDVISLHNFALKHLILDHTS